MEFSSYTILAVFFACALCFPLFLLATARVWSSIYGRGRTGSTKLNPFECGLESSGVEGIQFKAQYYHYGIVFLIFDVELAFLLPFAVAFLDLPLGAFIAMMLFILLMAEGLVWAWGKGILQWK